MAAIIPVSSEAIRQAMKVFDAEWRDTNEYSGWQQNRNYLHAIEYEGKQYPPKKIISIATGMPTNSFNGGPQSNTYLTERGFRIVLLRDEGNSLGTIDEQNEILDPFDPTDLKDGRERVLREVVQRRGQPRFRKDLLRAYDGQCAISGCRIEEILEAAHITPYLGDETNNITNGLLLRTDLHTLWDLGLIAVNPENLVIWVSPRIVDPQYRDFDGKKINVPALQNERPSPKALESQWYREARW
jgi:hypothetical protein